MKRYGLRDDQLARIEQQLAGRPGGVGKTSETGNRVFVEVMIWKFRSGALWRDLPEPRLRPCLAQMTTRP